MNSILRLPSNILLTAFGCGLLVLLCFESVLAQRVNYESLRGRDRVPTAYFDYNVIPAASPGDNPELIVSFKVEHDFLNFRTTNSDIADRKFSADVEIGVEVFNVGDRELTREEREELHPDRIRASARARRAEERASRQRNQQRESVGREFWNGTAYAATYEQTKSPNQYLQGYITKDLPPGEYEVIVRFNSNQRTRNTSPRRISVPEFDEHPKTQIYFLNETSRIDTPSTGSLINMGRNVFYGKDFNALMMIPDYNEASEYRIRLSQIEIQRGDTTEIATVYDEAVNRSDIHNGLQIRIPGGNQGVVQFAMEDQSSPYTYVLKRIPNNRFENANYRMELLETDEAGETSLHGSRVFLNRWVDIPISLLNVDVAIGMMRFIVDDATLSELRSGNERQRERKFREFWNERDPTPETEYNELMVEYYSRIDHVYENFTTPRTPGYESDMGKVYIQNGQPQNITRRLPPNQPAVEVWEYSSRRFTFVATTGFGDYQLRENM
ncbi:MAG: GWxTD domain-containing protein [Balneolales bacterium]